MVVTLANRVVRWGGMKAARRFSRAVPLVGGLIALATVGATMRRKGVIGGGLDAGLNAIPFVGAAKLAFESVWGRDMIPDRAGGNRRAAAPGPEGPGLHQPRPRA